MEEHKQATKQLEEKEEKSEMSQTALVICNTDDSERDDIERYLEKRNFAPEMFELDRIRDEQKVEYLNCINEVRQILHKGW